MSLLKEYKRWIILLIVLFISLFCFIYYIDRNEERNNENIISNWQEKESEIREIVSFYRLNNTSKLSKEKIKELQAKLKRVDCGSISKVNDYFKMEYKNNNIKGISFYYNIFDQPVADSFIKANNFSCVYKYYKPDVVLEMHGGVLGNECWSDYLRNMNSNTNKQ